MESDDFYNNNKFNVTSLDDCREMKGDYFNILKKQSSNSLEEDYIENHDMIQLNNSARIEDVIQKNIFDHDISVRYVRNRHKNMHYKKPKSKIDFYLDHPPQQELINAPIKHHDNYENSNVNFTGKINFKVKIIKLMNRKNEKILDIDLKEGQFQIYKSQNVLNFK
jgi:hypothetical protein